MAIIVDRSQLEGFIGRRLEAVSWRRIDQPLIDAFARLTGAHEFIHVDPVAAQRTAYGTTIAHGYLTLALLPELLESIRLQPKGAAWGINYGVDRLRFLSPVRCGAEIRAVSTLLAIEDREADRLLLRSAVSVDIRGEDKPALSVETLVMWILEPEPAGNA